MIESQQNNLEESLKKNKELMLCTSGVSMYPMLRHRKDMVVIVPVTRKLRVHDVPMYRLKSGKVVLHRIIKVTKNGYIIRGDNLHVKEKDITDDDIIGVLKGFYRNGKYYDCENSIKYKIYVVLMRLGLPFRFLWHKAIRPFLSKVKHLIFK